MNHKRTLLPGSYGRATGLLVLIAALVQMVVAPLEAAGEEDKRVLAMIAEFDQLLAAGQGPRAVQHLERVQQRHGEHPLVLTAVARMQMMQNNVQGAIASLTKALEKQPHQPVATALMANLDFRMGRGEQAQQRIDAALKPHPDSPELLLMAAQIKMAQQDVAAAEPIFKKVAENDKNEDGMRAQAYAQLGSIYVQQEKTGDAVAALREAISRQWHPDIALALAVQSEKTGDLNATMAAVNDFKAKLGNPQLAQIRERAMAQLLPIERRIKIRQIDALLAEGQQLRARMQIDSLNRELIKDAAAWGQLGPEMRRLELIERTQLLEDGLEKGHTTSWLANLISEIGRVSFDQKGEHLDKAEAVIAKAQTLIDETEAREVPAVLELARSGITIAALEYPDDDLKKVLEEKGLKPYRSLASAAKQALQDYFAPLAAARQPPPFEPHVLPYLENPTDEALRTALIHSFMEHAGAFDVTAEGATYQQVIPEWVWTKSGAFGPNLPKALKDKRESAYTAWNNFSVTELHKAGKWDEMIAGYDRAAAIYPRRGILLNRSQTHFHAGNLQAAYEDMALCAAVTMYELACSYRRDSSDLRAHLFALTNLAHAQSMRALAEGRRVTTGPGANAALMDALEHIRNERWIEVAEFVSAAHPDNSIEAWYVSQLRFGDHPAKPRVLDGLAAAAQATDDPDRQVQLTKLADPLGSYTHPVFSIIKARAAENDEIRQRLLESAISYSPRHVESNVMLAQLFEKQGKQREALVQYNVAAAGLVVADIRDPGQQEAARQRDRLAQSLRGSGSEWDFYLPLADEYQKAMYQNNRDRRAAARAEALLTRLLGLNAKPLQIFLVRADSRRFMQDWRGALMDLEGAVQLQEDKARVPLLYSGMGECYLMIGQPDQAMAWFDKAIDAGHKTLYVFQKRGDLHRSAGNAQAAIADYTAALEVNADDTYSLEKRSEIYEYQLEDYDKALADLKRLEQLIEKAGRSTTVVNMRILSVTGRLLDRRLQ